MMHVRTYLLFLMLFFLNTILFSQNQAVELTEDQWRINSEGKNFIEDFKEREPDKEEEVDNEVYEAPKPLDYNLGELKYVFYFLVLGLVIFLIIKIIINFNKNPTIGKNTINIESIEEIEEKMHEIDLEELLDEAIKTANYRIALRINFLIIIKLLSQKNEIIWAKEKTNWEYYEEVSDVKIKSLFKQIIGSFEPVWYGEHPFSENQFSMVSPAYEHLKKQLVTDE